MALHDGLLREIWKLDENADANRIGEIQAAPLVETDGTVYPATGINGQAVSNAYNTSLVTPYDSLDGFAAPATLSVWLRPVDVDSLTRVEILNGAVNARLRITLANVSGSLRPQIAAVMWTGSSGVTTTLTATAGISLDQWHLIAARVDASELALSVDGSAWVTVTLNGSSGILFGVSPAASITEQNMVSPTLVDEMAIWNTALSDEQIAELWNAGTGLFYSFGSEPPEPLPIAVAIATVPTPEYVPPSPVLPVAIATAIAPGRLGADSVPFAVAIATAIEPGRLGADSVPFAVAIATAIEPGRLGAETVPFAVAIVTALTPPLTGPIPDLIHLSSADLLADGVLSDEWLRAAA